MGAELNIYRLYRYEKGNRTGLILAKATRPSFPNWSQSAEDTAIDEVDDRFAALLRSNHFGLLDGKVAFVAAWEGGYPEGDIFYGNGSCEEIEVWLSFDNVHQGFFVFGIHPDEESFWKSLAESHELGEVCDLTVYSKPAQRVTVLFVK
jgi:hypothetical protein